MRIRIVSDGRVFDGSPTQIIKQMQQIAFGKEQFTLAEYIDWLVEQTARFEGITLNVTGETEADKAQALVAELIRHGLALGIH
jgi:aromatic ring-cleaving dioxygenase